MLGWNESALYSMFMSTAIKGTIVLCLAWLLTFPLRKRSAAARHLVWTAAAAGILVLPFLSIALPVLELPRALTLAPPALFHASAATSSAEASLRVPAQDGLTAASVRVAPHFDWRYALMLIWAMGAAAAVARMLAACAGMWRVRRSTKPFPDQDLCRALSKALGIRRRVNVRQTNSGSMPMTFGMLRPAIFMPADSLQWTEERRRIVLLHELAHVRRGDVAAHLLARAASAFYWWNPLAWITLRESLKEQERAADDLVLNLGTPATEYASHLLEAARSMQAPSLGSVAVAMARRPRLESRLAAVLDSTLDRKTPGRASAWIAVIVAAGVIAPLAAVRAQNAPAPAIPADVEGAIRAAVSEQNYQVLENDATAAEQLRKYDTAQKLLQAAAEIRGEVSGRQSADYGRGLLKLGDLQRKQNLSAAAQDFYTRAVDLLGDRPDAARALIYLGAAAVLRKDFPKAIDYFQHAERIDAAHAGEAMMWRGVVRTREQDNSEAETLFKSALSLQDAKSPEAVITMQVYSRLLREEGRADEAGTLEARAKAAQIANAQPAPAQSGDGPYHIGGSVTAPKVLQKIEPGYSDEARAAGFAGTVALSTEIGTDGVARNFRIMRGLGLGLDDQAIDAVRQWRFQPGTKEGRAVAVLATIEINFHLK